MDKGSDDYKKTREEFAGAAKTHKGKVLFIHIDTEVEDNQRIMEFSVPTLNLGNSACLRTFLEAFLAPVRKGLKIEKGCISLSLSKLVAEMLRKCWQTGRIAYILCRRSCLPTHTSYRQSCLPTKIFGGISSASSQGV